MSKSRSFTTDAGGRLRLECEKCSLPAEVTEALIEQASHLSELQEVLSASDSNTATARARALKEVAKKAAALRSSIEGLNWSDRNAVDNEFFEEALLNRRLDARALDLGESVLPRIEAAAATAAGRFEETASKAGRPAKNHWQVESFTRVARVLAAAQIWPSTTGPFRELSEAVYRAAGVVWPTRGFNSFITKFKSVRAEAVATRTAVAVASGDQREPRHDRATSKFARKMASLKNPNL